MSNDIATRAGLRAEIQRLRDALEFVSHDTHYPDCDMNHGGRTCDMGCHVSEATAALSPPQEIGPRT